TVGEYPAKRRRTIEALAEADAVIAVSRHLRERALALGADPATTRVVPNGVDRDVFSPGDTEEARRRLGLEPATPLVLAVGNLVPVKGFDVLLTALGGLGGTSRCVIVGEGPLRGDLERQVDALYGNEVP